jgi:hypothetical protein
MWGIANTLVTVATLLVPSRLLVETGIGNKRIAWLSVQADPDVGCCPYWSVTHSRDDLVTRTTIFAAFWYVTIRQ